MIRKLTQSMHYLVCKPIGKVDSGYIMFTATVQTVDCNGQRITTGGTKIQATQFQRGGWRLRPVQDNKNGTYTISDIHYNMYMTYSELHVKINDTPMRGSPFKVKVP